MPIKPKWPAPPPPPAPPVPDAVDVYEFRRWALATSEELGNRLRRPGLSETTRLMIINTQIALSQLWDALREDGLRK